MSIRRSKALLSIAFIGFLTCVAAPAAAQQPTTADLALIILTDTLPGFEAVHGIEGLPDGPLDFGELADLAPGGEELTPEQRDAISVYGRSWANQDNDLIMLILYKLPRLVDAQVFFAGMSQALQQQFGDVTPFPVPGIARALGETFHPSPSAPPAHAVIFRKATIAAQLLLLSDAGALTPAQAVSVAQRQAARMPAETAEAPSEADSESFGVELGAAIGVAVIMLGIATLATRSARRKRERPKPPPVPGTPVEVPAPFAPNVEPGKIRRLRAWSQLLMVLLGISGGLAVTSAIVDVGLIDRVQRLRDGRAINFDTFTSLADLHDGITITLLIALIVTGIVWLFWQNRSQRILGALQEEPLRFSSGAVVGWWFVPIANLVMPYRAMSELYGGSAAAPEAPPRGRGKALLVVWWFMFVSTSILERVVRTLDDSLDELVLQSRLLALIDLAYLFAAATAIGVVSLIFGGLKARATVPPPEPPEQFAAAEAPAGA